MPWETDGPRPTATELFFWIASLAAGAGFVAVTHWRDTSHGGDNWDWFDWLEATVSSLAAGLLVVGLVWVVCVTIVGRRG
jgi:hypothetical protein